MLYSLIRTFYRKRGQSLLNKKKFNKSLFYYKKLLFDDPTTEDFFYIGIIYLSLRDFNLAEKYLTMFLEKVPNNEIALLSYFETLIMQNKWETSQKTIEKLISISPNNSTYIKYKNIIMNDELRNNFILSKKKLFDAEKIILKKEYKKAFNLLEKALVLDKENPYILNNLGSIHYLLNKKPSEAILFFEKAVSINPKNKDFLKNLNEMRKKIK